MQSAVYNRQRLRERSGVGREFRLCLCPFYYGENPKLKCLLRLPSDVPPPNKEDSPTKDVQLIPYLHSGFESTEATKSSSATPVLKGVEPSRDTLDPPLSILVRIKDKLDGCLHIKLLLQSKKMLLPGTSTLGEKQHFPTGIHLEMRRIKRHLIRFPMLVCTDKWADFQKSSQLLCAI